MIVCKECGCENVQRKEWVNVNTGKTVDVVGEGENDNFNNWCPECEEHVEFTDKEE